MSFQQVLAASNLAHETKAWTTDLRQKEQNKIESVPADKLPLIQERLRFITEIERDLGLINEVE